MFFFFLGGGIWHIGYVCVSYNSNQSLIIPTIEFSSTLTWNQNEQLIWCEFSTFISLEKEILRSMVLQTKFRFRVHMCTNPMQLHFKIQRNWQSWTKFTVQKHPMCYNCNVWAFPGLTFNSKARVKLTGSSSFLSVFLCLCILGQNLEAPVVLHHPYF